MVDEFGGSFDYGACQPEPRGGDGDYLDPQNFVRSFRKTPRERLKQFLTGLTVFGKFGLVTASVGFVAASAYEGYCHANGQPFPLQSIDGLGVMLLSGVGLGGITGIVMSDDESYFTRGASGAGGVTAYSFLCYGLGYLAGKVF